MMFRLVLENVRHRPLRTILSILMIAVPVTGLLTLVGLSHGFMADSVRRARGVGADILIQPQGASLMQFTNATLTQKFIDFVATQPHVKMATGVINVAFGGWNQITGIQPEPFYAMSGGFTFVRGHGFEKPDDIIIDTYWRDQTHAHVGDTLNLLHHDWHVCGIVEPGKLSHIFVQAPVLQQFTANTGKFSNIYAKVDDPKNVTAVVDELKEGKLQGYPVWPMEIFLSQMSVDNIPFLKPFINVVIGIGIFTAFLVVALSMYMAILQRTREIGILKSLGGTRWFILELILAEALLMAIGGTLLGIALSYGTRYAIMQFVPASLPQAIVPEWWPIAGAIVLGAAVLGAIYPGTIAVRQDPIEALAYE
jgi:putative ABC transport system permease protein